MARPRPVALKTTIWAEHIAYPASGASDNPVLLSPKVCFFQISRAPFRITTLKLLDTSLGQHTGSDCNAGLDGLGHKRMEEGGTQFFGLRLNPTISIGAV